MPRLVGSAGAALLGTATVLTAIGGRNISGQGDHHVVQPGQPALRTIRDVMGGPPEVSDPPGSEGVAERRDQAGATLAA